MIYLSEREIKGAVNRLKIPTFKNPCPADGHTKREYVKNLIRQINIDNPGVKERFFTAIVTGDIKGWPKPLLPFK